MQRALEQVHVSEQVGLYMVDLVAATRTSTRVQVGATPRGTLALLQLSRGRAALDGRDFVTPDDVKAVAVPALAHRLTLRPELWVQRVSGEDVVREALDSVPTPRPRTRSVTAPVKRTASPKLGAYAGLAALGLLAALVLGRPELAVLAAPFALVALRRVSLAAREPEIRVALELDRERAVEGEIVTITIDLRRALRRSSGSSCTSRCRTTSSSSTARPR